MDVDIVHGQSPDNIGRLLSFLKKVDAVHRRLDEVTEKIDNMIKNKY